MQIFATYLWYIYIYIYIYIYRLPNKWHPTWHWQTVNKHRIQSMAWRNERQWLNKQSHGNIIFTGPAAPFVKHPVSWDNWNQNRLLSWAERVGPSPPTILHDPRWRRGVIRGNAIARYANIPITVRTLRKNLGPGPRMVNLAEVFPLRGNVFS